MFIILFAIPAFINSTVCLYVGGIVVKKGNVFFYYIKKKKIYFNFFIKKIKIKKDP